MPNFEEENVKLLATLLIACIYGYTIADEDVYVTQPFGKMVCKSVELYPDKGILAAAVAEVWDNGTSYDSFDKKRTKDALPHFLNEYETSLKTTDPVFERITSFKLESEE